MLLHRELVRVETKIKMAKRRGEKRDELDASYERNDVKLWHEKWRDIHFSFPALRDFQRGVVS